MLTLLLLVHFLQNIELGAPFPVDQAFTATALEQFKRDVGCTTNQRAMWQIVWSCLLTIFTCTWVSVHPNIPDPKDSAWKVAKRRLGLMIWTILVPEFVILWAVRQWVGARKIADRYRERGWTKTHGYFLQMGGFILHNPDGEIAHVLLGPELEDLLNKGLITLPKITEAEIQDRGKSDSFTKSIAFFQTTWFVTQCIARHAQGLVVTELEITTLALATLNGLMYFFWWNKPLAVRYSVAVLLSQELRTQSTSQTADSSDAPSPATLRDWGWKATIKFPWRFLCDKVMYAVAEFCGERVITQSLTSRTFTRYAEVIDSTSLQKKLSALVIATGNLFGAIHCIAWSSFFPSTTERTMWHICSLVLLTMPELLLLGFLVGDSQRYFYVPDLLPSFTSDASVLTRVRNNLATAILVVTTASYTLARFCLIFEAFFALRTLTPAALANVDWTLFLPHI